MKKNKEKSLTDWKKVDAHIIQPHEYDEIPELDEEWFEKANFYKAGKLVRRGRPLKEKTKSSTTLRLDSDILNSFKAMGKGWQTKMNDALREWLIQQKTAN